MKIQSLQFSILFIKQIVTIVAHSCPEVCTATYLLFIKSSIWYNRKYASVILISSFTFQVDCFLFKKINILYKKVHFTLTWIPFNQVALAFKAGLFIKYIFLCSNESIKLTYMYQWYSLLIKMFHYWIPIKYLCNIWYERMIYCGWLMSMCLVGGIW